MMKIFKKALKLILLVLLIIIAWNFKLILYGIDQLKGQLHIVWNARPTEEILKDPTLKDDYKRKILLVQEIKKFAVDSLGLKNSENYTTFYDQQGKPVLWVLTACPPFEMKAYEWHFPFLGNVSYKGFFKKEKGEKEFQQISRKGFDAELSTVSGWSTLGWFKDPVLSNFLKRPDGVLAEIIIHELTHATIYLKSNVDYNENLATFVGEQGTEKFLDYKFGKDSKERTEYFQYKSDEEVYGNHMLKGAEQLDSLYKTFDNASIPPKEKHALKYQTIASILLEANRLPLFRKKVYRFDFKKESLPNNAFFMSFMRYRKKQVDFEKELQVRFKDDLRAFIEGIKHKN